MIRRIITIHKEKCNGCGLCAAACHEGAIAIVDGKAVLLQEDHCDGLGDCLPACPVNAISFEQRDAASYDEAAVRREKKEPVLSRLSQWPVQIKLAPLRAQHFDAADLLVAADCTAYACGDFHNRFMDGRVTLIGCPKLDAVDYAQKLAGIIENNDVRSITVVRMEVPCCGGIENAAKRAIRVSGKELPWKVITVDVDGEIRD